MLSHKQFEASRAKAQRSVDPNAEEAAGDVGVTATRHRLTGQIVVLPMEEMQAFNSFCGAIEAGFAPETAIERQLAHLYASYQWRINRAAHIEDTLFAIGGMEGISNSLRARIPQAQNALSNAMTFRGQAEEFERISIYSNNLLGQSESVLRQLKEVQSDRKKHVTDDLADAARLYHFHRMQNQLFNPRENGFDLTLGQIEDHIRREKLQNEAQQAQKVGFDTVRYNQKCGTAAA